MSTNEIPAIITCLLWASSCIETRALNFNFTCIKKVHLGEKWCMLHYGAGDDDDEAKNGSTSSVS